MEKEDEEMAKKEEGKPNTTSLFPVFHHHQAFEPNTKNDNKKPQWLCNTSFITDLSTINDAVSSRYTTTTSTTTTTNNFHSEDEEEKDNTATGYERPSYELLHSSASASDRESSYSSGEKKRRHKKEKRKRKRSSEEATPYDYRPPPFRKPDFLSTSSPSLFTNKDYYFDSRGDRDNLAFGCVYRMDVARYKPYNAMKSSEIYYYYYYQTLYGSNMMSWVYDGDGDVDALDTKLKSGGLYWSAKYKALECHKNFKRIRIVVPEKPASVSVPADFIPLSDVRSVVEESWEDEVLRKTREFNNMTRERPHDEKVWLAFAEFHDRVASMQPHKGARLQTLEKKIGILEKATKLNSNNEDLLLGLMNAYQSRDTTDVLIGRWDKILMQHSGSYKLWREFLHVVQREFSRFKVSEMRKLYADSIMALSAACSKQFRQVDQTAIAYFLDPAIVQQELGLVDIFLSLCRFEWQSGYQELATALFQAEIEYSLFCPSLLPTEHSKRRLFEYFWNSSGARVGEDGALGWSTWLEKEEEQRQKLIDEESAHKIEEGGWTCLSEQLSINKEIGENLANITDHDVAVEEFDEETEGRDIEQKDDSEYLLKMLGIDPNVEANGEIRDTTTWTRWSKQEFSRDSDQWMPVRAKSEENSHSDGTADREGDDKHLGVILFEDISECLFSIRSEQARLSLVSQFIDFYGGRKSQWTSTNSSSWTEKTLNLEVVPDSILDDLRRIHDVLTKPESPSSFSSEFFPGTSDDISTRTSMMNFLRNAILLCLTAFPHNYVLEEAALVAEELSNTRMNSCSSSVTPCRALAKSLLKSNRQDILLCGVYAQREAAYGNMEHARRVFDMALSSIEGLPLDSQSNESLLYFWYAELELANGSGDSSESSSRAMYILSCFGGGVKYSPFICQPSNMQQLRARQGYKERLRMLWPTWARGVMEDHSVALICSAALFEALTTEWAAGIQIFNQAFSMVLPERRSQSYQLEYLFNYYVRMLQKHHVQSKLSNVWNSIVRGLQIYPFSPRLYNAFLEISHLHTTPNNLRRILDDYRHKKPSVIVWLFALSFETSRGSSHRRVHRLFERALANGMLHNSVILWRCYIAYEINVACDPLAAKRIYFQAIHACPWSKKLWLDGFLKLNSILTAKELSDLQEVMRDKEVNLRTDIYEILLQDEIEL